MDRDDFLSTIGETLKAEIKKKFMNTSENSSQIVENIKKFLLSPEFKELLIVMTKITSKSYLQSKSVVDSVLENLLSNLQDVREKILNELLQDIIPIVEEKDPLFAADLKSTKALSLISRLRYKKQSHLRDVKETLLNQIPNYANIVDQGFRNSQNATLSQIEKQRWNRQINHLLINQATIKKARVAVFGCGGIGSNALVGLSYAGVQLFRLIDFDTVDLSNLNRQTLYTPQDVDRIKLQAAKERLLEINPNINAEIYNLKVDYPPEQDVLGMNERKYPALIKQVDEIIKWSDFAIIALDYLGAPYLINDLCIKNGKPFYWAGVNHYYGDIYSFSPRTPTSSQSACLRCIFSPNIFDNNLVLYRYKTVEMHSSPPANVGTTVIATGNLIAEMIIKDACDLFNNVKGNYLIYNAYDMDIIKIPIEIDPDCECQQAG